MSERTTEIKIEVTTNYYGKNGELIDAIASNAKLTKADAGRSAAADEDLLTIKHDVNSNAKAQIDYNGTANSTGEDVQISTEVELNSKSQVMDRDRGELIDTMTAGAKITKADAGRMVNETSEIWLNLQLEESKDGNQPIVTTHSSSKLTKADAGRTEKA